MRRSHGLVLGGLLLLLLARPAQAQLAVIDAANLVQNVVTAIQTVIIVANQVLELTGLDEIVLGEDFSGDMEDLGAIVREATGLSYDLGSLQGQIQTLFSLDTAPDNTTELQQRLRAIRRVVFQSYSYAMRTQTLLATTLRTVQRLTRLIGMVSDLVGNMQANRALHQAVLC